MNNRLSEIQTLLETGGGHISGTNALINSHAIAMQAEIESLQASLKTLQDNVENGFQGGCWCCEPVAMGNIALQAELKAAEAKIERISDYADQLSARTATVIARRLKELLGPSIGAADVDTSSH